MRRLLLVANPSSSGFTGALHRDVVDTLGEGFDVVPIWPVNPAAARQRAADAVTEGFDIVVAMGGDGVVHHVANGLIGTSTALGVIPAGTTNVVARIHGMPRDPRKAARALLASSPLPTNVVHITTDSDAGAQSEYALFSLGIGFDADVVEVAEQRPHSKLWFGSIHFARAALGRVLGPYRSRLPDMTVEIDDDSVRALAVMVQVHDIYTYFGRLPMRLTHGDEGGPAVAALTSLDPVVAARIMSRLTLRRDLARLEAVHRWTTFDTVVVTADGTAPFQADGEHLGHTHAIEIRPITGGLLVLQTT
jgi:diacylglycerol kinase family enzyme